jgi:ribonuclease HII
MPDYALESAAGGRVAGIDEAGRGPLAGPVVAAAVVLSRRALPALAGLLDDSKRLTVARREVAFAALGAGRAAGLVEIGVGAASVDEITRLNILRASLLAMGRAVARLKLPPELALVDGNQPPALPCAVRCVVGGDRLSLSIAAASIVAKVLRDRAMARLALRYPGYGWQRNAGYGTLAHRRALLALGPTCHHRPGFAPVAELDFGVARRPGSA